MTHVGETDPPLDGDWQNERGSVLHLTTSGTGLTGTYRTALGAPDRDTSFPVTGFQEGNLVGFVVAWQGHDSLTSWAGRYERSSDEIHALWHLVSARATRIDPATGDASKEETPLWEAFRTQHSVFRRLKTTPTT